MNLDHSYKALFHSSRHENHTSMRDQKIMMIEAKTDFTY